MKKVVAEEIRQEPDTRRRVEVICLDCGRKIELPEDKVGALCVDTGGPCYGSHMQPTHRGRIQLGWVEERVKTPEKIEAEKRQRENIRKAESESYYCSPCGEMHPAGYDCSDYCGW